jgi:hypothetical protein
MSISEKANDLLNKFGRAQFDFMIWNTPDNLVARDKARQEISDYITELEDAQRWIPVSESLPELDQDVLAIVEGDIVTGHFYQQWDGEIYFSSDDEGAMMVATHWMPLPKFPEVQA